MKVVERYECPLCHELKCNEYGITNHLLHHAIDDRIAELWKQGKTLKEIDVLYHMFQGIYPDSPDSDDSFLECHHNINKDNCFKISYLQCWDYPVYRIYEISSEGRLKVWGNGYRSSVSLGCLRDPRPASELYIPGKFK